MGCVQFKKEQLQVKVFLTREEMGKQAAEEAAACLRKLVEEKGEITVIFAAAPSQNDFLQALQEEEVPWKQIRAVHMDEYIGIRKEAPQGFAKFLKDAIFDRVPLKNCSLLNCETDDPEKETARYSEILRAYPPDVAFIGIGENGHIAFNDPGVADFADSETAKIVCLEETSRLQQVNDGCFSSLDEVPKKAITVTIPPIFQAKHIFCMVPCETKADAVYRTLNDSVGTECPSTILRNHPSATLYLDRLSAAKLTI